MAMQIAPGFWMLDDGSYTTSDPNAQPASWSNWLTPEVRDYSSLGSMWDPMQDGGGGALAPTVTTAATARAPVEGETYQSILQEVSALPGANSANTLLEMHRNGFLQQLPGFDAQHWATIQPQLDAAMHDFNSDSAGPGGMLEGALIHGGNMLEDAFKNPLNPDPLTSWMTGGEASDFLGRPSEQTYQEQADAGIDVTTSQMLNNLGSTIGLSAAGAGLTNALGMGGATSTIDPGYAGTATASNAGIGPSGSISGGFQLPGPSNFGTPDPVMSPQPQAPSGVEVGGQSYVPPAQQVQPSPFGTDPIQLAQGGNTMTDAMSGIQTPQMPPAQPAIDPTFGGQLTQTAPGAWENLGHLGVPTPPIPANIPGIDPVTAAATGATAAPVAEEVIGNDTPDTSWPDDSVPGGANGGEIPNPNNMSGNTGFDWNTIPENIRSVLQNALAPQNQMNWMGLGADLINLSGQRQYQQGLLDTMNRAVDRADPFYAQRSQYQQQFNNMNTNPNWMNDDAVLQGMQNNAMRNVSAQNTAKGYLNSGNILHDLTRTGVETAGNYALPRMQQVGQAAGAFNGPGQAGQLTGTLGSMANQAGMMQNQTLGNMMGRIPQAGTNAINSGISNWLGGLFAS